MNPEIDWLTVAGIQPGPGPTAEFLALASLAPGHIDAAIEKLIADQAKCLAVMGVEQASPIRFDKRTD